MSQVAFVKFWAKTDPKTKSSASNNSARLQTKANWYFPSPWKHGSIANSQAERNCSDELLYDGGKKWVSGSTNTHKNCIIPRWQKIEAVFTGFQKTEGTSTLHLAPTLQYDDWRCLREQTDRQTDNIPISDIRNLWTNSWDSLRYVAFGDWQVQRSLVTAPMHPLMFRGSHELGLGLRSSTSDSSVIEPGVRLRGCYSHVWKLCTSQK